jgi:peptide/nickel transport system permease protein
MIPAPSGVDREIPVTPVVARVAVPRRLRRSMTASGLIGLALIAFWLLIALFGPLAAPHRIGEIVSYEVFEPMSSLYPLGTDYLGRDMLSRVLLGARYTVGLALIAALLASTAGTALGIFAAVSGRWIDEVVSRLLDALICIPSKIFALVMVAAFGSSLPLLLFAASLSYLPGAYRIARSLAVNLNMMEYVQIARARGEGRAWLACVEILPNMIHPMLADFGLRFVFVVLLLSGLSFLGLGVQPPDADLGSLVRENISGLAEGAPAVIAPALAIATLTIGVNLLIDSLAGRARRANGVDR